MSELTNRIIDDTLRQRPAVRHAHQHDPTMHQQVEWARGLLSVVELAIRNEGVPADIGERVLAEAVRAGFAGWERDKLSRERLLLLADMDPTELRRPASPVFTEPGPGAARLADDVSPERMSAWLEKEQERLREATGFDLSARPDGEGSA